MINSNACFAYFNKIRGILLHGNPGASHLDQAACIVVNEIDLTDAAGFQKYADAQSQLIQKHGGRLSSRAERSPSYSFGKPINWQGAGRKPSRKARDHAKGRIFGMRWAMAWSGRNCIDSVLFWSMRCTDIEM